MKILIETIPHNEQRYPTVGDWQFLQPPFVKADELGIAIKVSATGDWREEALVAIHELNEVLICKHRGITQEQVDAFDMEYEKTRTDKCDDEPGDNPTAPYYKEHQFACNVEKQLADALDINYKEYLNHIYAL